ncbi:MAG: hypothetical protein K0S22_395 [Oscillospiraceae bacterium]|jgi:hypothetical protein|nr:hypothetical protein [Oscillospiraceae bacterium]
MVRMEVFEFDSSRLTDKKTGYKEKSQVEDFIAQVGYDNIKNIIVSNSGSTFICYSIFYEDGQPYTPYVEEEPKKKGIFG